MLVAACIFGHINSEDDDANYTATKEQFIELVILNKSFRDEFDSALNLGRTVLNDKPLYSPNKKYFCKGCIVFAVSELIYDDPQVVMFASI